MLQRLRARARRARCLVRPAGVLLSLATITSAVAQSGAAPVQQLVIAGSRLPVTASGLAQNVTVIDRAELLRSSPARLEDVLGRVTGVYVDAAGKAGGFSSLYMRGAEQSHLLIMIDGVKVNDPTTTRGSAYDLSSIDVQQIERIEVLRGPASAVHGGEALAGVVNIITKKPAGPGVAGSVYGGAGQEGYRRLGASVSTGNDKLRGQLSVGASRDGRASDGRQRVNSLSGSLRVTPSALLDGEVYLHRAERRSDAFPDDSGGPRLAVNREQTRRDADDLIYGASVGWGDAAQLRLQGGVSVYERDEAADNAFVDPGVRFPVPAFTSNTDFRRTTVHATATRNWGTSANLVVGVERQTEKGSLASLGDFDFDGNADNLQFGLKRRTDSLFAEARLRVAQPLAVQIGLRRDRVQGIGSQTTPHLGAVWELPNDATTLKANYSKGFKPPSFFALGFPIGGNPDLRSERSENVELIAAHRFDTRGSSVQASVFRIEYTDLIDFDPNTFTNVNRGTIVVKGIEPALKWQATDRLLTQLGLTLLDISEQDGLAPLRSRPEKRAAASVLYTFDERASLFAAVQYTGKYLDRSNPTGDIRMPGHTTVDAAYTRRFGALRTTFAIDNVFDRDYEQFIGFPALGRRVRIELRAEF